jgi:hypothetical protein
MKNNILWAMLFIAAGYSAAYFVCVSKSSTCKKSALTEELEAHVNRNAAYESEKLALLNILDSVALKLDSTQKSLDSIKKKPGKVNFADSTDMSITNAFITHYGASNSTKLSVARDHLIRALNALDSLALCRETVEAAEAVIKTHEEQHEAMLDLADIHHAQVANLDSGLTKCIESHKALESKNGELVQKLEKQETKTSRWRIVAFVSLALNGIQAWLR